MHTTTRSSFSISGKDTYRVGLISDTHGLLRPEAVEALNGSDLIMHAGDIGDMQIINRLDMLAPVVAVRGNMDSGHSAYKLKSREVVEVNGNLLYILHDLDRLDIDPEAADVKAVIYGHSHRQSIKKRGGVYYLNPGSAGPRRFRLAPSVALLHIKGHRLKGEIIELPD